MVGTSEIPESRRRIMASIRSKNTKPELIVRRFLHSHGFRFRLHRTDLPGCPDVTLPKYRTIIFIHGCFWHLHRCRFSGIPKTRYEWWSSKLESNKVRDERNQSALIALGWSVELIWECEINPHRLLRLVTDLRKLQTWKLDFRPEK